MAEEQKDAAADADPNAEGEEGGDEAGEVKEDEADFVVLGSTRPNSKTANSMYTPPEPKTDMKFTNEEKADNELVRRWRVVIQDIEIINQTSKIINPFVKFIIGGDYFIDIKKLQSRNVYLPNGTKGISQLTDKISYLDAGSQANFESKIEVVYQASYFELMEQHLHIEVWNANRFFLNTFIGYESVQMLDIAQGSVMQQINVYDKIERDGEYKQMKVTLNFKLVVEEIWDYMIKFIDWRSSNLENRFEDRATSVNPKLEFNLSSDNVIQNNAQSIVLKNTKLPYWQEVGKGIIYRGTQSQLAEEFLDIKLLNKGLTSKDLAVPRSVSLQGVLNSQLEVQMQIHKDKLNREELFQAASVKGLVRLASMPKFLQQGSVQSLKTNMRYLVVYVTKLNVIEAISAAGDPQVWVEVEWGGIRQKSRMIKGRPQLNQEFYFQLSLSEAFIKKAQRAELVDAILQEVRTKPEITITVWADPANGKKAIISLGKATVALNKMANAEFQDRFFTDPKTRKRIDYQARVLFDKAFLHSAFQTHKGLNVELSMWFQQELPYPDIDLGSLKGSSADVFPREIAKEVMPVPGSYEAGEFFQNYYRRIETNFACLGSTDMDAQVRRVEGAMRIWFNDFAKQRHILPQFMSKIASQDQNILLPEEKDDEFLEQLEQWDWFKKKAQLARGIRTLREVAHFVRSIAITPEFDEPDTWSSPDVMLTMRQGQLHDHALLMASMFRACKYETMDELKAAFVKQQASRNAPGAKKVINILAKAGIGQNTTEILPSGEASADGGEEEEDSAEKSDGDKGDNDDDDEESEEKAGSDDEGGDEDDSVADESDVDIDIDDDDAGGSGKDGGDGDDNGDDTVEDRVFVCVGRFKNKLEKQAVWVMTFDKEFQVVTLWNPVQHKELELKGRIEKEQIDNLKAYLTPFQVAKEAAKSASRADLKADEKYCERVKNWRQEYREKVEGVSDDDEDEEAQEGEEDDADLGLGDDDGGKGEGNSSEEEYKADEDFINADEIIVKHQDLDQVLKGYRIEQIGEVDALGKEKQDSLEHRVDIDEEDEEDEDNTGAGGDAKPQNFFAKQRAEMQRQENLRDDKHLLPATFKLPRGEPKPVSDYAEIHLIFNHKNIWANLQNADPLKIKYELHDDNLWLPFVRDSEYPHRWDSEEELLQFKRWLKFVESERTGEKMRSPAEEDPNDPNRLKFKLQTIDYRIKGEFMQPFQPFFGPKERLDPMPKQEIADKQKQMLDEIESVIKQMRSIAHINQTNMNWTKKIRHYIDGYLNFMEDVYAGRFSPEDSLERKEKLREDLNTLIPSSFQASIFPLSINFVDQEKVIALLKDKMNKFATTFMKQQQFAIGVKIFPFDNRVVSLHLIVVRIEKVGLKERHSEDEEATADEQPAAPQKIDIQPVGKKEKAVAEAETADKPAKQEKINLFKKKRGAQADNPQAAGDQGPKIPLKKK